MLSIIIPTKDRGPIFHQTLDALRMAVAGLDTEIIVVNDSKKNKINLQEAKNKVEIIENDKSGAASARNKGARTAHGEYLLFLDDDMIISHENLRFALDFIKQNQKSCLNLNWVYPDSSLQTLAQFQFGRYLLKNGLTSMKGLNRGSAWNDRELFKTRHITSQFLIIKKSIFEASGGYDESLPFAGFEDYILSKKLTQNNVDILICPYSVIFHNESDRLQLKPWLERQKRGAITRRKATEIGYTDVSLNYPVYKKILYPITYLLSGFLFIFLKTIPNKKIYDPIYFKAVNVLLGTYIFEGYSSYHR